MEGKESEISEIDGIVADGKNIKKSELETSFLASNDEDVEAKILSKKDEDIVDETQV